MSKEVKRTTIPIYKMTQFLSEHIGMYITDMRGIEIDVQKEYKNFLNKEGFL